MDGKAEIFLGLLIGRNNFCFEGHAVPAEIITNSAQLGLELGLSLAIIVTRNGIRS